MNKIGQFKINGLKNLLIVFLCLFLGVNTLSANGMLQAKLQKKISLNLKEASLRKVLDEIQQQSKVGFVYKYEKELELLVTKLVSLSNVTVEEALHHVLRNTPFTFKIVNDAVTIVKREEVHSKKPMKIKGRVLSAESRTPIVGATIWVMGTQNGAVSDDAGNFLIQVSEGNELEVSYVGMRTLVYSKSFVEGKELVFELKTDAIDMKDVVVTGYQTIEKWKSTGEIQTLNMEDIKIPGVQDISKLLESKVPGMIFMQNSGQVGATPKIRVRGTSTVLGNQEPLWVLDGIVLRDPVNVNPQLVNNLDFVNLVGNAISGINPEDIERIDILKDAASTALYGAKAANGVIVITTKKGKVGPPSVSYSFNGTFSARPRYTDKNIYLMNSKERIEYSREVIEKGLQYPNIMNWVGYEGALYDYNNGKISYDEFSHKVSRMESANTDWFKLMTKDVFSHGHTFSISGGSSNVRYYASLGYSNEKGVIKEEKNDRYTASMNITGDNKRFQYSFGLMASMGEREYANPDLNILDYAYNSSRAIPAYNEDGSLYFYDKVGSGQVSGGKPLAFNALHEMQNYRDNFNNSSVSLNANLTYRITDDLKIQGTFGYGLNNNLQETFISENSYYASTLRGTNYGVELPLDTEKVSLLPFGGEYREGTTLSKNYTARVQADYIKFLDSDHRHQLVLALGYEVASSSYKGKTQTHRGYLPERGKTIGSVPPTKYPGFTEWNMTDQSARGLLSDNIKNELAGYLTASYTFDNTYTLNFNIRADASNKFGSSSNNKLLPVWAVSASWDAKRKTLQNVNWVNVLIMRGSFGYQGNMLDNQTPELIIKKGDMNNDFGEYGSTIAHYPNPNLRWEKTQAYNIGLDFSLFENRIRGTLSYFYKKTIDAFLSKQVSDINGVEDYVINSGNIENKGFEVSFNITPIKSSGNLGGFRWDIDPQFGQIVNTLLTKAVNNNNFDNKDQQEVWYNNYLDGSALIEGEALNTFYSYKFEGLSPLDGRPMFYDVDPELRDKYIKMAREDVYRSVMSKSGTRVPVIQGGISNTFSYKRMSLNVNFAYSLGSKMRLMTLYSSNSNGSTIAPLPERNMRAEFNDRWRRPGDEKNTKIPGLLPNSEYAKKPWWDISDANAIRFADNIWQMYDNSDLRTVSGNYFKLQSFSFNYSLPEEICRKFYMKAARIGFSGYNIFTICDSKLKGQDPTQSGTTDKINLSLRPSYSVSVGLTF